jgi:hypothetical protein
VLKQLLDQLQQFTATATAADYDAAFGNSQGRRLWVRFCEYEYDLLRLYGTLDRRHREALADWLLRHRLRLPATVTRTRRITIELRPPAMYAEPVCRECGQPLTAADVEAGEDVCPECAPGDVAQPALLEAVFTAR